MRERRKQSGCKVCNFTAVVRKDKVIYMDFSHVELKNIYVYLYGPDSRVGWQNLALLSGQMSFSGHYPPLLLPDFQHPP